MTLAALIFDFDGLIVDTEWPEYQAWAEIFTSHGAEFTPEEFAVSIGTRGAIDYMALLADKLDIVDPPLTSRELHDIHRARNRELIADLPLLAGVLDHLEVAAELGLPCAIASSSSRAWIEPHLHRHNIAHYFTVVSTWDGEHVGFPPKPAPDIYLNALRDLGIKPTDAIAFEDSRNGLIAAKAAGLRCVVVPNKLTASFDFSEADHVTTSLANFTLDVARSFWR